MGRRVQQAKKGHRGTVLGVLLLVGVLVLALGGAFLFGSPEGESSAAADPAPRTSAAPASATETDETYGAAEDPVLVPRYPTRADAETAFVSEVAGLDSWNSSAVTAKTLADWKTRVTSLGHQVCRAPDVQAQMRALDGWLIDQVDQVAFAVEAAYYLCNERIASMGQGLVATGELTPVPVTSKCPAEPDITFDVQDTSSSQDYSQPDWTTTARNNSDAGAMVYVEQRDVSDDYVSDWLTGVRVGDYGPHTFAPHTAEQYTERNSGVHDDERPEYRLREGEYLALDCGYSTTELRSLPS